MVIALSTLVQQAIARIVFRQADDPAVSIQRRRGAGRCTTWSDGALQTASSVGASSAARVRCMRLASVLLNAFPGPAMNACKVNGLWI